MGREARTTGHWKGDSGDVKALLEAHEVILRGQIRARIARPSITNMAVEGDSLILTVDGEMLKLDLGAKDAERWLAALSKPAPSLAQKLGVSSASPAFVIGPTDDAELRAALDNATVAAVASAAMVIAILAHQADLSAALETARPHHLPIWCVAGKGKSTTLPDSAIRAFMRRHGLGDNKSCTVSERLTATRYVWPKTR